MENQAYSLQDKIQKLIDQYTLDKQKLAELDEKNNLLTEENMQLIKQIDGVNLSQAQIQERTQQLDTQLKSLESKYLELQKTLSGFELIATDAISKIDNIFPEFSEA
ncbi:MAG: hypothetical protein Q8M98_04905 [Candidatus Cloacimonadaceae bacterium]|nr:hypothetical protein [Candidatus Cloacimonadaceae bacterium]MDP3114100.1 hypothetical protein [Candidatus Cloacimonadaceae bacterium]